MHIGASQVPPPRALHRHRHPPRRRRRRGVLLHQPRDDRLFSQVWRLFPGSGDFRDVGHRDGNGYSVNFPLKDGLNDASFRRIFKPVISKIMERYQPGAVVMCCGADSIAGDRLGCWNLSLEGHGHAIDFVKSFNVPVVLLGGGGYTPRNVARCWAYETAIALGKQGEMDDAIPNSEYLGYFAPDYRLTVPTDPSMTNMNSDAYLDKYTQVILQQLGEIEHAPSVPFQKVPKDFFPTDHHDAFADVADPNVRAADRSKRAHEAEFYANERDVDAGGRSGNGDDGGKAEAHPAPSAENRERDASKSILSSDKSPKPTRKPYPKGTECAAGSVAVVDEGAEEAPARE